MAWSSLSCACSLPLCFHLHLSFSFHHSLPLSLSPTPSLSLSRTPLLSLLFSLSAFLTLYFSLSICLSLSDEQTDVTLVSTVCSHGSPCTRPDSLWSACIMAARLSSAQLSSALARLRLKLKLSTRFRSVRRHSHLSPALLCSVMHNPPLQLTVHTTVDLHHPSPLPHTTTITTPSLSWRPNTWRQRRWGGSGSDGERV